MRKNQKITPRVLFLTFSRLEGVLVTASAVRPFQMCQAMERIGCVVDAVDGMQNRPKERKEAARRVDQLLRAHSYDFCYVELPSGPMMSVSDYRMMHRIHRSGLPIYYYHRDAYWKFQSLFAPHPSFFQRLKHGVIGAMEYGSLQTTRKTGAIHYVPTEGLAKVLSLSSYELLPPGARAEDIARPLPEKNHAIPVGIFVGGVSERYGTIRLLRALSLLNREEIRCRLILVCRADNWEAFCQQLNYDPRKDGAWLEVHHVGYGEALFSLYGNSDFAFLPLSSNAYNDLAFSVKLMEYLSFGLPILSTPCREMARFITRQAVGRVVGESPEDYAKGVEEMISNLQISGGEAMTAHCREVASSHTWEKRAEKLVSDWRDAFLPNGTTGSL